MTWIGDCLVLYIYQTKNDETGEAAEGSVDSYRRIYANPEQPWKCPILMLAIYIFTTPRDSTNLFPGEYQNTRFGKDLRTLLRELPVNIVKLVCNVVWDIGMSSLHFATIKFLV